MKKSREMKKSSRKSDTAGRHQFGHFHYLIIIPYLLLDTFKSIELIAGETGREGGGGRSKSKRKTRDKISVLKVSVKNTSKQWVWFIINNNYYYYY